MILNWYAIKSRISNEVKSYHLRHIRSMSFIVNLIRYRPRLIEYEERFRLPAGFAAMPRPSKVIIPFSILKMSSADTFKLLSFL